MKSILSILAVSAALAMAGPAFAKNSGHCPPGLAKKAVPCVPPGLAKKGVGVHDHDHDHDHDRVDDHDHDDRRHADRRDDIYVDRDGYVRIREHDGFRRGDVYVDRRGYVRVRDYDRYRLPRLRDGEAYYRDGNVVFRVDRETRQILELIQLTSLVLGN